VGEEIDVPGSIPGSQTRLKEIILEKFRVFKVYEFTLKEELVAETSSWIEAERHAEECAEGLYHPRAVIRKKEWLHWRLYAKYFQGKRIICTCCKAHN